MKRGGQTLLPLSAGKYNFKNIWQRTKLLRRYFLGSNPTSLAEDRKGLLFKALVRKYFFLQIAHMTALRLVAQGLQLTLFLILLS